MQGIQVQSPVGNSDPTCCMAWLPQKCNRLKERLAVLQEHQLWGLPKTRSFVVLLVVSRGAIVIDGNQVIKDGKEVNHVRD